MSNSPSKENLKIKIVLSGTFWEKLPEYSILVDDTLIERGTVGSDPKTIEFETDVDEDCSHLLKIRLENKTDLDTVQNDDCTKILKDMLLNIESIEIDEVSLGQLIWDESKFVGDDPSRPELKQCVNLGWNGTYILEFTSPYYLWLLENM